MSFTKPKLPELFSFQNVNNRGIIVEGGEFQRNRFQIVIAGDPEVGKSTYLKFLRTNEFEPRRQVTERMDVVTLFTQLSETGRRAKLVFFDLVGQDINRSFDVEPLLQHTDAVVAFFDASNDASFESLKNWKKRLDASIGADEYHLLVVCNKIDLLADEGEQLIDKVSNWTNRAKNELGANRFILISAKTGENCYQLCYELIVTIFSIRDKLDKEASATGVEHPRMSMRAIPVVASVPKIKSCCYS